MDVTVLIAAYNAEASIAQAVLSALEQDFPSRNREVIVVNDGSTDSTLESLKPFENRIQILDCPHCGLSKTCNAGLEKARGTYFVRLDADDQLAPDALSSLLAQKGNAGCVYSDYYEEYPDKSRKRVSMADFNVFKTIACGILFSRATAKHIGGYDELLFEEYDFLMRYLRVNPEKVYVPRPLYHYFRHGAGMTDQSRYLEEGWKEMINKWGDSELAAWDYRQVYPYACKR
jgi:glycosyltransferase involved in cell wall biosynthesis